MKRTLAGLAFVALTLPGCASTISAYKNRSTSTHGVMYKQKFLRGQIEVMSGERRVAIVLPKNADYDFCAEALPDVAAAFGAASTINVSHGKSDLGVDDRTAMGLMQTFNRTENAEMLRTWGFLSCLAVSEHHFDDPTYRKLFGDVTQAMIGVMKTNAANTHAIVATGGTLPIDLGGHADKRDDQAQTAPEPEEKKDDKPAAATDGKTPPKAKKGARHGAAVKHAAVDRGAPQERVVKLAYRL